MANSGATAFLAGLLGGGVRGYAARKEWDRHEEQDKLINEARALKIKEMKREAADAAELRAAAAGGQGAAAGQASMAEQVRPSDPVAQPQAGGSDPIPAISEVAQGTARQTASEAADQTTSDARSRILRSFGVQPGLPAGTSGDQGRGADQAGLQAFQQTIRPAESPSTGGVASGPNAAASAITRPRRSGDNFDFDAYWSQSAPRIAQTLLKQGRVQDAKNFVEFADTREGKQYAKAWASGARALAFGDTAGALRNFEKLYNDQLPDGNRVRMAPITGERDLFSIEQIGPDGTVLGSRQGSAQQLASAAAVFLSPTEAVKHFAGEQSKRAAAADTAQRQQALEVARQQGRLEADDRTLQRTQLQIDAADRRSAHQIVAADNRLARQLEARADGGGLTAAQQRSNFEIDAARDAVAGLTPEDIRRRTAPTTATGRENPDYDPRLARHAALAARRKIGQDEVFDAMDRRPAPATPERREIVKRFQSDAAMSRYRLGRDTPKGVEVLDAGGTLRGYYR